MIILLFSILIIFYAGTILRLYRGLKKIERCRNKSYKSVSVIVAARNEQQSIGNCVEALLAQDYPKSLLEIIIIDDQSADHTFEIVLSYVKKYAQVNILRNEKINHSLNRQFSPGSKKQALSRGFECASGELLLFTDADCVPPPTWVTDMVTCFDEQVGVVVGFSPLIDKTGSCLGKLIEFDSLVAATIAASGIGLNKPITCTGRNLAYRKKVFAQVNGFNDIAHSISGDDDLFLHLVSQKTAWKIKYNVSQAAIVPSYQTKTVKAFFIQKRRHISAGKYYPANIKIFYSIMHVTNFSSYFLVIGALIFNKFLFVAITLFLLKMMIDFFLIQAGAKKFNQLKLMRYFPLWAAFYFFYHLISGPWAMVGKIKWDK